MFRSEPLKMQPYKPSTLKTDRLHGLTLFSLFGYKMFAVVCQLKVFKHINELILLAG